MSRFAIAFALATALAVPSAVLACPGHDAAKAAGSCGGDKASCSGSCAQAAKAEGKASCGDHAGMAAAPAVKELTVAQLAQLGRAATPVDANGPETRSKQGVIPGAVLLTSSAQYDAAKELPAAKDAKLVFYCANAKCSASKTAAKRALEAGFTDVNVLPDGIKGWKDAGQKTASVPAT